MPYPPVSPIPISPPPRPPLWRDIAHRLVMAWRLIRWRWLAPPLLAGALIGMATLLALQAAWGTSSTAVPLLTAPSETAPDLTVTMSQGLLNALVQQSVARGESPVPLEDVRVETRDQRLVVRGTLAFLGRGVSGTAELQPYIENGALRMRLVRARFGVLPVPSGLERLAEGPINARVRQSVGDLPATLTSVRTSDEGVTVTARVRVDELRPGR